MARHQKYLVTLFDGEQEFYGIVDAFNEEHLVDVIDDEYTNLDVSDYELITDYPMFIYNTLIENQIISQETLDVITGISGLNEEVLYNVLEYKTGYKNLNQYWEDKL